MAASGWPRASQSEPRICGLRDSRPHRSRALPSRPPRPVSQRQAKALPYIDQRFSERIDRVVIMAARRCDAQKLCAARDRLIVDRMNIDAMFVEQKVGRFRQR